MTAANRAAAPRTPVDAWTAAAVLMAVAAMVFHAFMPTKDDISWLITNAEALLDSKELYKDIIETNPPLSVLLYLPAVLVERLTGLRAELATVVMIGLIGLGIARVVRRRLNAAGAEGGGRLEAVVVLVFLVLPLGAYGQKDQVAALIALPFFVELMLLAEQRGRPSIAAGVLAGLCVAVKPHFVLAVLFPCLWLAARAWRTGSGSWLTPLFNPGTIAAGITVVAFQGFVYLAFPTFFRDVLPMVLAVYVPIRAPLEALLVADKGFLFVVLLAVAWLYGSRTPLAGVLAAAGLGFFAAYLLQAKGWPYHLFPATGYGLLLLFGDVLPHAWAGRQGRPPLIAVTMAALILAMHSLWMMVTWIDWSPLTRAIVATGIDQPTVLNIAASHDVGHPSTRDAGGRWVGTFSCRWLTVMAYNARPDGGADDQALAAWIAHDRAVLRRDIAERRPDVILVDRRDNFDWLAWAREDPDTARLLDGYRPAGRVAGQGGTGGIDLLRRADAGSAG